MKENYTDITFLLDRSGSMAVCLGATIEGGNAFIRDQQETKGDATFTLIQFDDRYEHNFVGKPMREVQLLTTETYRPRGWTYLFEAMGRAINETGARLAAMPENERPSKVVFVVLTDGREQHGRCEKVSEFTQAQVAQLVKQQREVYNWEFVFLGANQNAILEAQRFGIAACNAITYAQNDGGTVAAFRSASSNIKKFREGSKLSASFEVADYKAQEDAAKNDRKGCCMTR